MAAKNPTLILAVASLALGGCGGTKLLKEPHTQPVNAVLATAADEILTAHLDWIIVRDRPGARARSAAWDEYLLRVR